MIVWTICTIIEIHLIGERERGPTLEMILTKIRKMYPETQILGLSATVANSEEIANWLGCELVESNWRPIKLVGVYQHGIIRMNDGNEFKIDRSSTVSSAVIHTAIDSLKSGGQALIFAETRKLTSSIASRSEGVYKHLE